MCRKIPSPLRIEIARLRNKPLSRSQLASANSHSEPRRSQYTASLLSERGKGQIAGRRRACFRATDRRPRHPATLVRSNSLDHGAFHKCCAVARITLVSEAAVLLTLRAR